MRCIDLPYIILINLLTAVLVPLIVPLVHPVAEIDFWTAFSMIMAKVFPLLIMPCMAAWLVRYLFPKVHRWLLKFPDLAFYIWAFALTLAIALTTRFIVHSEMSTLMLLLMALISLVCCVFQFAMGRFVGRCYRSGDCRSEPAMTSDCHARPDRASMQASREMYLLLDAFDSTAERNIFVGLGDLYVTVFGGRNRKLGALLG